MHTFVSLSQLSYISDSTPYWRSKREVTSIIKDFWGKAV